MIENKQIYTQIKQHRSKLRVRLFYRYYPNNITDKRVRTLTGIRWSRTMSCWYITYRKDYKKFLQENLKIPVLRAIENAKTVKEIFLTNKKAQQTTNKKYNNFKQPNQNQIKIQMLFGGLLKL